MLRWVTATNTIAWQYRYNCSGIKKNNCLLGIQINCLGNANTIANTIIKYFCIRVSPKQSSGECWGRWVTDHTFCILDKYILQFGQIHCATWTTTFCNLELGWNSSSTISALAEAERGMLRWWATAVFRFQELRSSDICIELLWSCFGFNDLCHPVPMVSF